MSSGLLGGAMRSGPFWNQMRDYMNLEYDLGGTTQDYIDEINRE